MSECAPKWEKEVGNAGEELYRCQTCGTYEGGRCRNTAPLPAAPAPTEQKTWLPTPENVNALPEGVRSYIHQLVANCDPAGNVAQNVLLRDQCDGLQVVYRKATAALAEVRECFIKAEVEGLSKALTDTQDEHLKDLVERRLMHAYSFADEWHDAPHTIQPVAALPTNDAAEKAMDRIKAAGFDYSSEWAASVSAGNAHQVAALPAEQAIELAHAFCVATAGPKAPDSHAVELPPGVQGGVDYIMEAVQCFASEWSLVGGRFDSGDLLGQAEATKKRIRSMLEDDARKLAAALAARQAPAAAAEESAKLAPILRSLCEGGGADREADIYHPDFPAADGDVFVLRAADLLAEIAARQVVAPDDATLRNWLAMVHDNELSLGDRLQRLSVAFGTLLNGGKVDPTPYVVQEPTFCACAAAEAMGRVRPIVDGAVERDAEILNWLETKSVNVREPLRYGSRDKFWASPEDDDDDTKPSDLRSQCLAALAQEQAK